MQTHINSNKRWTKREDDYIRENYTGMAVSEIAIQLGRSEKSTRAHIERLGLRLSALKRYAERFWTKDELGIIKRNYDRPINEIMRLLPNKSFNAVYGKCREYGRNKKYKGYHYDSFGRKQISLGHGVSMAEHRKIMEDHLGRKLSRSEQVHHINFDKKDNRIENLYLCESASSHAVCGNSVNKIIKELMERGLVRFNRDTGEYEL